MFSQLYKSHCKTYAVSFTHLLWLEEQHFWIMNFSIRVTFLVQEWIALADITIQLQLRAHIWLYFCSLCNNPSCCSSTSSSLSVNTHTYITDRFSGVRSEPALLFFLKYGSWETKLFICIFTQMFTALVSYTIFLNKFKFMRGNKYNCYFIFLFLDLIKLN